MATTKEFLEFVLDSLRHVGDVTVRPMMGEYVIYYRGRLIGDICDNCLLLKQTPSSLRLLPDAEKVFPYPGAKHQLLAVDCLEDRERMAELLPAMYGELPEPKAKQPRRTKK